MLTSALFFSFLRETAQGLRRVRLFVPYWIQNNTGLPLMCARTPDSALAFGLSEPLAELAPLLMYSLPSLSVSVARSPFSDPLMIEKQHGATVIELPCKSPQSNNTVDGGGVDSSGVKQQKRVLSFSIDFTQCPGKVETCRISRLFTLFF